MLEVVICQSMSSWINTLQLSLKRWREKILLRNLARRLPFKNRLLERKSGKVHQLEVVLPLAHQSEGNDKVNNINNKNSNRKKISMLKLHKNMLFLQKLQMLSQGVLGFWGFGVLGFCG